MFTFIGTANSVKHRGFMALKRDLELCIKQAVVQCTTNLAPTVALYWYSRVYSHSLGDWLDINASPSVTVLRSLTPFAVSFVPVLWIWICYGPKWSTIFYPSYGAAIPLTGASNAGGIWKIAIVRPISRFISEMIQYRFIVTVERL